MTYSNEAKSELLGVAPEIIAAHGAVSAETAAAMAQGAVARAPVELAISVTGIAGPGGATPTKPVGLIILGMARRDGRCRTERRVFPGDRSAIRQAALQRALELLDAEALLELGRPLRRPEEPLGLEPVVAKPGGHHSRAPLRQM